MNSEYKLSYRPKISVTPQLKSLHFNDIIQEAWMEFFQASIRCETRSKTQKQLSQKYLDAFRPSENNGHIYDPSQPLIGKKMAQKRLNEVIEIEGF